MTMDGMHVLFPDIGADKLWLFDLLPEGKIAPCSPSDHVQLPGGSGPRHLAAHPNGRWLYLICEISCQIVALSWSCPAGAAGPAVAEIGSVSTLPADWPGTVTPEVGESLGCTTAHIVVSPDGRFVYGSNRVREGEGSIVCFAVDGDTGALSLVAHTPSGGITPRNFCLSPSGDWLVVANASSNNVSCFPQTRSEAMQQRRRQSKASAGVSDTLHGFAALCLCCRQTHWQADEDGRGTDRSKRPSLCGVCAVFGRNSAGGGVRTTDPCAKHEDTKSALIPSHRLRAH